MPLQVTERSRLVDRVIDQLRAQIESREWPVGTKIPPEPELVRMLGVGRNTVREAVRALVHSGMLEALQGDGTYVRADDDLGAALRRRLRRASHLEALEVRGSLERDAARLAALRRSPADVQALRAALDRRESAWRAGQADQLIAADLEFHRLAVAAAHNDMLADLYAHLTDGLRGVLDAVVHSPMPMRDEERFQHAPHAALVTAIAAGDPDAAQRCVETYLRASAHVLERFREAER